MADDDDTRPCPHCGTAMEKHEDLSTTYWECPHCGHTEDEDEGDDLVA